MDVEVVLFDAGGTPFDRRTAIIDALRTAEACDLRKLDSEAFSTRWRQQSTIEAEGVAEETVP